MRCTSIKRRGLLAALTLVMVLFLIVPVCAAETAGWNKAKDKIFYNLEGETGLEKATGLQKIAGRFFLFDDNGYLKTGWVQTEEGIFFFKKTGALGVKGRAYRGLQKINKKRYYFDPQTCRLVTGKTEVKPGVAYYFSKTGALGVKGVALTGKWKKTKGLWNYFGSDGKMACSKWITTGKYKYYVDAQGNRLVNTVTPDGYLVGSNGRRVSNKKIKGLVEISGKTYYFYKPKKDFIRNKFKTVSGQRYYFGEDGAALTGLQKIKGYSYYFNEKGVMQTGEVTISKKKYFFKQDGKQLIGGTAEGYTTDANGVITAGSKKPKILVIAGHGQGDAGAVSGSYQEQALTREFAKLIVAELKKIDGIEVEQFNPSYDMFRHNYNALANNGVSITGNGAKAAAVKKALKTDPVIPDLTQYAYALEIHYNATAVSLKDPNGNGSYKGFSFYVNQYKPEAKRKVERTMINRVVGLGFKEFGSGIHPSATLTNCKVFQELGVDYALMETAFIDDADDMRFYQNNKLKMAKVIAEVIANAYKK
ncbi:MAG: N-acetylmuramoyl-L-alanine amidase [Lachnospiraceae bacterium]|nr:N-acetylmuramoyl-L-alanine amidase [Lachnospiraceae bacterium]